MKGSRTKKSIESHNGGLHRADTETLPKRGKSINTNPMQTGVIMQGGEAPQILTWNGLNAYANAY